MCNHANKILNDFDKAQDISQHTIINLWQKRDQIKEGENILSYLMKSVHNNCLNFIRDESRRIKKQNVVLTTTDKSHIPDYGEAQELMKKINEILSKEDEQRQKIFRLNRFDGLTSKEIAEKIGMPVSTVKYHISMVMKKMQEQLAQYLTILLFILINIVLTLAQNIFLV